MAVRFSDGTSDTTTFKHLNASGINGLVEQKLTTCNESSDYANKLIKKLCFEDDAEQNQWKDGNVFIEVSIRDNNGNRVSKKLDFGKILKYLSDAINTLGNTVKTGYLTQAEADGLYVSKKGDEISGSLTIITTDSPALNVDGSIRCGRFFTANSITSNTTIHANGRLTANGITSNNGLSVNGGDTQLSTLTVDDDATFNGNLTNTGSNITAKFSTVSVDSLSVDSLQSNTTTLSGDTTSNGTFTSNGSTTLSGNTTVKGDVKLQDGGSLYLTDNESKIYAGDRDSDPSIGKSGTYIDISNAKIDKATINEATIGNDASNSTVLKIMGSATCTTTTGNTKAQFSTTNLNVVNTATFESTVHASNFKATDGYYLENATANTHITADEGLVQTSPSIVEITAKQACWA